VATEPRPAAQAASTRRPAHPGILAVLVVATGLSTWASFSVELPAAQGAIKGDESTYIAMALSLAGDGDLAFDRGDLTRFRAATTRGPEGIFLKRGRDLDLTLQPRSPFVANTGALESGSERLYFGKAWVHAVVAAPFAWLFGLRGLVLVNALLLVLVVAAGWRFAAARTSPWIALALSSAFVGATVAPVYALWLTPEVVNVALVFLAMFLWFYKDVADTPRGRLDDWLTRPWTEWAGIALLALATFSKPPNVLLIGALAGGRLFQGRARHAIATGVVFGALVALFFGINALVSGEANYQGGDRKTFYGRFPFESPDATFDTRGIDMATDDAGADEMFDPDEFWSRFRHNLAYFFVGRHFGQIPYHFPGLLIACFWLTQPGRWRVWQVFTALAIAGTALALLVFTPFSWSGGGGPLGNRYFLSIYPAYFFLLPPLAPAWLAAASWAGGLLFTAAALADPVAVAWRPGIASSQGPARYLPVELTMVNDLPVMLTADRGRVPYGQPPDDVLLYFLDDNAWLPEPEGIWVTGGARADLIVRSGEPIRRVSVPLRSLRPTRVTVSVSGVSRMAEVKPGAVTVLTLPVTGAVYARRSYSFVLSVEAEACIAPSVIEAGSTDQRCLGAQFRLQPTFLREPPPVGVSGGAP
jgi:hypothetical protein